ncbi:MAG: response regulator [Candidatus Sumerlaeia bacterium]|nr:response regulator [Candidatus Sumerlaeia bacterium]
MTPRPRVLIASHDREAVDQLRMLLDARGYRTEVERTGPALLERARSAPPAAIIASVRLPRLNGYELLCAVRADSALAKTPVLLLSDVTTESGTTDAEWARLTEATAFFTEPMDPEALLGALSAALGPQSPSASN